MFKILGRYTYTFCYIFVWNKHLAYTVARWYSSSICIWMATVHIWNIEQSSVHHIQRLQVSVIGWKIWQKFLSFFSVRSYKNKTGKMRPILEAVRPLMPFTTLFIITTMWVLLSRNDICFMEPRLMFLLFGTIFSNICVSRNLEKERTQG